MVVLQLVKALKQLSRPGAIIGYAGNTGLLLRRRTFPDGKIAVENSYRKSKGNFT